MHRTALACWPAAACRRRLPPPPMPRVPLRPGPACAWPVMGCFTFYIFNRKGRCQYYHEWQVTEGTTP